MPTWARYHGRLVLRLGALVLLGRLVEAGINGRMYASGTPMWFPWRAKLINEYLFYISSVFLKEENELLDKSVRLN